MRRTLSLIFAAIFSGLVALAGVGRPDAAHAGDGCTTLKDGILTYSSGHYLHPAPLSPGYDDYGYNYQAHTFNGSYANVYLGGAGYPPYDGDDAAYLEENPGAEDHWAWPYRDVQLMMKWNDAWLSNQDCDGDGTLDRHLGFDSYIGSGAWLTNHQSGTYTEVDDSGKERTHHWSFFVKIVAAPSDATLVDGSWIGVDGEVIGPAIWGSFAVIQEVYNDNGSGVHGLLYKSPTAPGVGLYKE